MLSLALFYNEMHYVYNSRNVVDHILYLKTYFMHATSFSPHHAIEKAYMVWMSDIVCGREGEASHGPS